MLTSHETREDHEGFTALHLAAEKGHTDVIKCLLNKGAQVDKSNHKGFTALHLASLHGQFEAIEYLLTVGADLNKCILNGRGALHLAAQEGHIDITKHLITKGAKVNETDKKGYTPLHLVGENGNIDITNLLLSHGAIAKNEVHKTTPLHLAANNGRLAVVNSLLSQPSSGEECSQDNCVLNEPDDSGCTAIHLATRNGHSSVVKALVSQGADLNIQSQDGQTCLHEAIKLCYHTDTAVESLEPIQKISEDFYQHELSPEKALVLYLLEHEAKIDIRDDEGKLPIHYATNEVIRQIIFSRLPSLEMITRYRAKEALPLVTVSAHVDTGGKQINLADLGISMSIPPGAVPESDSCEVTLTSVQDPPNINIQRDESLACLGIRCDPPHMIFHQPVKISIPHSASIVNPDQVKPDIVCRVWDSAKDLPRTSRTRSSSSPLKPPYCRVNKRHLELYIGHCAEWWVLIPLEQQANRHQLVCTPYITDKIERGKEFEIHLQMHADLPGIEMDIQDEKKQQSYHKSHRSVPFSVESKSGDVTVTCHREGKQVESKVLSLKDVYGKMRHNILLSVTPTEDDVDFTEITITIKQAGRLGVSGFIAFIIRHTDGPEYQSTSGPTPFVRTVEEVSRSKLQDIDVLTITKTMTVDQFYDLGVALDFTIQQLDVIEYRSFRDRQQATYDMLVTWRKKQPSGQAAKETFLSLMESLDAPAEEFAISDFGPTGEIPDSTLLAFARQIGPKKFYEIGGKLGFNRSELQHIEYRTLYNRYDATVQMLSKWKASQTLGPEAKETLKRVWKSVQDASKAEKAKDKEEEDEDEEVAVQELEVNSTSPSDPRTEQSQSVEPEDISIITNSDSDKEEEEDKEVAVQELEVNSTSPPEQKTEQSESVEPEDIAIINNSDSDKEKEEEENEEDKEVAVQELEVNSTSQKTEQSESVEPEDMAIITNSDSDKEKEEEENEEDNKEVVVQELEVNSTSPPEQKTEQSESLEPEEIAIIEHLDSDGDHTSEDFDLCGGSPSTGEQCSVVLPVKSLSLAWDLGKALRLKDDDVIVGFAAPSDSAAMNRLAWQLLRKCCTRLGSQEKKVLMTKLLQDYHIQDCNAGLDEISKKICTTPDLLYLSQLLDLAASEILQVMSTSVSFPPTLIRHIILQMLQEWVQHGGTRMRLLEIAQAFNFNDAADKIATAMEHHPGFLDPFSHGIIDHDGGELKLDELDIGVSIPAGAIPKGMRSVVTLCVPSRCSSKIPLKDGDVLITPVIECSITQELLKPATIALPHCINSEQHQDDLRVNLYNKSGPGIFGYRSLLPNKSNDFHISEGMVSFPTSHLQLWALTSRNVHGVQFTCEVLQPLFMLPSHKSTLRTRIAHPCNRYPTDICRRQESSLEPFYQVMIVIKFRLESAEDDLKLSCISDSKKVEETVPVRCLLNGACNTSNFELLSSHTEGGKKTICLRIEQGTSTLAEQQIPISIEVKPDYGASYTHGRIKFASDKMLKILSGLVCSIKDARDLGYQIGFSHSTVEKYLARADSSASSVSSSGFREMLREWRRRVRPSEQVKELRLALEETGLSYEAEVLFNES